VTWADWDEELLALEIGELQELDFDLGLTVSFRHDCVEQRAVVSDAKSQGKTDKPQYGSESGDTQPTGYYAKRDPQADGHCQTD
jgi:hypothetical protein